MENFRKPLFYVCMTASALTMLGAALGWFDISNKLVQALAESELGKKQNLAIGLSAVSLLVCIAAVKSSKHRLAFLATLVSMYELIMIVNQKPNSVVVEQIGLTISFGYWLSIIGTLAVLIASAIIGIKGFDLGAKK